MIACFVAWLRGLFGSDVEPIRPPDVRTIEAKYVEHDELIATLQDRERRLQRMNEALATGKPSGNMVSDIFNGTWPPRHRRQPKGRA